MLQHLVRVHDVEGVVGELERVQVGGAELDVARGAVVALGVGRLDRGRRDVDADHVPGVHPVREVERDGAGPAADVEDRRAGREVRHEIRGGVLDGAPAVRAQNRFVVAVRVAGGLRLGHRGVG